MSMQTNLPHGAHGPGQEPGTGYEQRDANIPDLLKFGFWMAVVIVVTLFAMKWTFNYMERTQVVEAPASPFVKPRELPPSPRLQVNGHQELKDYCEAQERELNTYGWVDQRLRVVHIPIDKAMDLVLKNGLPVRANPPTGAAAVAVPPPMVAGGDDLQGPCAYVAKEKGNGQAVEDQAAELGRVGP
jgi:hypothetical protein